MVGAFRDVLTYFVVGTSDSQLAVNQTAYGLLQDASSAQLAFVTFPGGHDYRQVDVEQMYLLVETVRHARPARRGATRR